MIPAKVNALGCTLALLFTLVAVTSYSEVQKILFREDFNDLNSWKPLYFPKIKNHTSYTVTSESTNRYLRAESNASASAMVYKETFDVREFPLVKWRWKVENVYGKGNAKTKAGDDYPLRIYIVFKYDPGKAGLWDKAKYRSARLIYGEYPPHSSLNYIWANQEHKETILTNSYTERAKMILIQKGSSNAGKWQTQEVDITEDYQKAFGRKPPAVASIAIMNDSDNTAERAVSYLDYIEVRRY